jgi:hypothetical protein
MLECIDTQSSVEFVNGEADIWRDNQRSHEFDGMSNRFPWLVHDPSECTLDPEILNTNALYST